ncbi:MAG: glycosyltransferase family 4 protein [Planctomycetes bacterium]|nr:glycosyltransferase family 4 protein [Planctomycetota bacterium]
MKVGIDIRPALFGNAGIARYARELCSCFTEMEDGPFLELYAPTWRGGSVKTTQFKAGRFKMHRGLLPARGMDVLHKIPGFDAGRYPAKVDVFHWSDYVYPQVTSAASVMTLHDAAFAVDPTFHGWNTATLLDRVRNAINQSNIILAVSEPGAQDAELMGADPEDVRIVPNGVNPMFQPSEEELEESGYILTVGTIEPRKNYLRILRALERLWDQDAAPDWIFVGKAGWDYNEFLSQVEASKHKNRIRWIQDASDGELLRLYQGCHALVYPSLHEGFGLPVLEAMACRKPVLVGDNTAPSWVAGPGGMRVQPTSVDSIQEGIERILTEKEWTSQAAAVLHRRAQEFTWEKSAQKTLDAYQEAIERFAENGPRT